MPPQSSNLFELEIGDILDFGQGSCRQFHIVYDIRDTIISIRSADVAEEGISIAFSAIDYLYRNNMVDIIKT